MLALRSKTETMPDIYVRIIHIYTFLVEFPVRGIGYVF